MSVQFWIILYCYHVLSIKFSITRSFDNLNFYFVGEKLKWWHTFIFVVCDIIGFCPFLTNEAIKKENIT